MELSEKDIKKFLSKFTIGEDDDCWNWNGRLDNGGYGKLSASTPKHTTLMAHRVSYTLYVGNIMDGMIIMHMCDNPRCVNPKHLMMGTQKENIEDCVNKNRRSPQDGSNNNSAKLTEDEVKQILKLYIEESMNAEVIAEKYRVGRKTVFRIVNGDYWGGVEGQRVKKYRNIKLDIEKARTIRKLYSEGVTQKELSLIYSVDDCTIYNVIANRRWKENGKRAKPQIY